MTQLQLQQHTQIVEMMISLNDYILHEAKCLVVTHVCECLSVPRRIPTLLVLHGPRCNLWEW